MTDHPDLEGRICAHCAAGRHDDAAREAIEGYGPEIFSFLRALSASEDDAAEAFARFCEQLWLGLRRFRGDSTVRTWAYVIARRTWQRQRREPHRRIDRRVPLSEAPIAALAERVRTRTISILGSIVRTRLSELRDALPPDDRTLLILRVDRRLAWREIARVIAGGDGDAPAADDPALTRRAAALRKRFERLKLELRDALRSELSG